LARCLTSFANASESKVSRKVYIDYLRHLLRLRFAKLPVSRFTRFAVVGLSGVVVDMGLLFLLSDPSTLGWGLTRSKLLAAELAIVNNFIWKIPGRSQTSPSTKAGCL
jgi:dolichol-phosphate mannosyltransferase